MPFTLAHPAAVWPLKHLRIFAVLPLIIGSLTPDLASYLPDSHAFVNSHSLRGTIKIDLPLGYALLMIMIALRNVLVTPLWQPHRNFISESISLYIGTKLWWLYAIPSLLIGSWTHVAWDSFTHENHFMVRRLPILQQSLSIDGDHTVQLYRLLQYGCSILGMMLIGWWYLHSIRQTNAPHSGGSKQKYLLMAMVIVAFLAGAANALLMTLNWHSMYWLSSVILTTAMPVFAGLYLLASIILWHIERPSA